MTSSNEEKINKLLDFPYDAFLMVRLEYVQILGDELEAKLLRIIEKYVDMERKRIYREMINAAPANNGQVVEVTKDIWVPISYRLFMNDLFGTVTSENTVKKALKDMTKKKIIFQRFQPKKKYDAPEYKIHVNPLQTLLSMLPNPGYQKLIPSYIDTLKDLPPQELTPSECQKLIPLAALRVSKIDTNITEVTNNNREVITEERESSPNTLDTHTIVSSDTAPASYPLITFAHCLTYLQEQGVAPQGEDAVQVMVQARTLYAHKHPRYEYRARPGLVSHPDDQLPSQDEEMFTNDAPQGDTHATAASGHSHRVGNAATASVGSHRATMEDTTPLSPEARPVLEAQEEITEGDTHATRVPTLPRADHPASGERDAAGHPQSDNHCAARAADDLPVVRAVGRGTTRQEGQAGRAQDGSVDKKDAAQTLTETPPTSTPAQSLPLPQAEQAAPGATHSARGTRETAPQAQPQAAESAAKWNAQAMVDRACELRGKPFSDTARPKETKAAQKLFDRKPDLTEEEFERAFQQWNTQWWRDTNGLFNLTDLAAVPKNKSEMRLIIALEKLALPKARVVDQGKYVPVIAMPNQPITNIRELVRQREALRAAALVGV